MAFEALDEMTHPTHGTNQWDDPCCCERCEIVGDCNQITMGKPVFTHDGTRRELLEEEWPWAAFWLGLALLGATIEECDASYSSARFYENLYGK